MARTVRNAKIDTRSARSRLTSRREPYWTVISGGCALGYRRGSKGGTWIARFRDDTGHQHYESLGSADDVREPDGLTVYSFSQAQELARTFFTQKGREVAGELAPHQGPYTIEHAIKDYLKAYERKGGRSLYHARRIAEVHVIPALGNVPLSKLTAKRLEDWHQSIAEKPARLRTKPGRKQNERKLDKSPEGIRRRRATANRILTVLKAALNYACKSHHAASDSAWRHVRSFKAVDTARIRYLTGDECVRLVNACEPAFRNLVRGALLTGCRYSELTSMNVSDFDPDAGIVTVSTSKAGKPRHVVLTDEGQAIFSSLTDGKGGGEPIFGRPDGGRWRQSHQLRPMLDSCNRARIRPAVSFHVLRHTYGSTLAMRGVPLGVIATQLGHADTRMTEKHYAHLAPSYVADTIRAQFPKLGIIDASKVTRMRARG